MKYERIRRGWSQEQLEHLARIPQPQISLIETGRLKPTEAQAIRLASALDIPPGALQDNVELSS